MLEFLLKHKIATIIPMQESFLHIAVLPKNITLSKEIITLNYEKLSPFLRPFIIAYREKEQLYIWFIKRTISNTLFIIPESFLLYMSIQKEQDGIYVFDTTPKKIFIIKNSRLLSSFISDDDLLSYEILKNEYSVTSVIHLSKNEYQQRLKAAMKQIKLSDLYQFLQISLKKEDLINFFIEKVTYPFIFLLFLYISISYTQSYFMQQKVEALTQEYQKLKSKNIVVKQAIRKYNQNIKQYERFVKDELHFQDPYKVVYDLYDVIKPTDKAIIKSIDITNNTMRLVINTKEGTIKYLKRLNKIDYFKNVVIQNSYKRRDGIKTITFFIEMKEI